MKLDRVSYSSLIQFKNCPHQFRLNNIDKVGKFQSSIHTIFGTIIHSCVQNLLVDRTTLQKEIIRFSRTWKTLYKLYRKQLVLVAMQEKLLLDAGISILKNFLSAIDMVFINWSVVSIEQRLQTPVLYDKGKYFKGFIDTVLKYEEDGEEKYVVIDFKTCGSVFWFLKNKDKYKEAQLVFYKHFLCEEMKIDPKNVETYFVLLEKNPKSKNPVHNERITSGKVKINNCIEFLKKSLSQINVCEAKDYFPKNRSACYDMNGNPQCPFFNTEFCKK